MIKPPSAPITSHPASLPAVGRMCALLSRAYWAAAASAATRLRLGSSATHALRCCSVVLTILSRYAPRLFCFVLALPLRSNAVTWNVA